MLDFDYLKIKFEYFLIPTCFFFGLIGNTIGSICILSSRKTRERTPLFIQASIGLSDNFLLMSQMQRWLAVFLDHKSFLINNSLCKVYFMILRCSILTSAVLTFYLPMIRYISLYHGNFRLSTYSNLGQMCSRLSVAYVLSISLALSWHELWTSGLKDGEKVLIQIQQDFYNDLPSTTTRLIHHENLKCHKNVISYSIIHVINLAYFCILFSMYSGLIVLPFFLCLKIYKIKSKIKLESHGPRDKSFSLPLSRSLNSTDQINRKTFSVIEISRHLLKIIRQKNKASRKKFTLYICIVSFLTGVFCFPYTILDLSYYKDAQVDYSLNSTNSSTTTAYQLNRLPLLLINIPHCIKFYLLFILYPKFRSNMTKFLKIRLYVNFGIVKNQFRKKSLQLNSPRKFSEKKIKFVVNRYNSKKSEKFVFQRRNKNYLKNDSQVYAECDYENKFFASGNESENSSILGYDTITNMNRRMLSLSNTGNYIETYDLDTINIPTVSSPVSKKIKSSSTFDFIDKSKCISSRSNSSIKH